ncbi:MAG: 23S rRNA (guanosine(2251)-2'-O)-methyltransferase RlmB [Rickettsiales bacterium]|nr:23S rRNA (guanosine(2251)-2'-O)-methyltransferase RlmB [Rickettsiales bacterium]
MASDDHSSGRRGHSRDQRRKAKKSVPRRNNAGRRGSKPARTRGGSKRYPDQLEGRNLVLASLRRSRRVREIWLDEGARPCPKLQAIESLSQEYGTTLKKLPREQLDEVSMTAVHNGIIGFAEALPKQTLTEVLDRLDKEQREPFLLILDQVQYEQNLGAVLRSAACAGVDAIVVPTRRGAPLSATAQRIAMGAAEQVPVVRESMTSVLAQLRRRAIRVLAAEASGNRPYFEANLCGAIALVMGGEDRGVSAKLKEGCEELLSIPIQGEVVTSLNVSVATGILLFERLRQQTMK